MLPMATPQGEGSGQEGWGEGSFLTVRSPQKGPRGLIRGPRPARCSRTQRQPAEVTGAVGPFRPAARTWGPAAHQPSGPRWLPPAPCQPQRADSCTQQATVCPINSCPGFSLDPLTLPTRVTVTPISQMSKQRLNRGKRLVHGRRAMKPGQVCVHAATKPQTLGHL